MVVKSFLLNPGENDEDGTSDTPLPKGESKKPLLIQLDNRGTGVLRSPHLDRLRKDWPAFS
jgi:hypothetical protein